MIDGDLFDKFEYVARCARKSQKPFGGLQVGLTISLWYTPISPTAPPQLVICGDFFQLPPVPDRDGAFTFPITFAFEAAAWKRCISRTVFLTRVFRQKEQGIYYKVPSSKCCL